MKNDNENGTLEIVPFFIKTGNFNAELTIKWER